MILFMNIGILFVIVQNTLIALNFITLKYYIKILIVMMRYERDFVIIKMKNLSRLNFVS